MADDLNLIEAVAKDLAKSNGARENHWRDWAADAESVIAAINASGTHWVAPVEATAAMRTAWHNIGEFASIQVEWSAMRTAYLAKTGERVCPGCDGAGSVSDSAQRDPVTCHICYGTGRYLAKTETD